MDKILRFCEVRNLDTEEQRKKAEETRTVEFVISSSSRDRHKTSMNMDNWKLENFNNNPVIGYQHDVYGGGMCNKPDPDDVIAKGRTWIEDGIISRSTEEKNEKLLIGSVTFETADINPKADKIFKKVLFGSLRAASVGIMPIGEGKYGEDEEAEGRSNETFYFEGQELLEFSIVNIPSNTDALKRSMTTQVEQGIEYLRGFIKETIKKDIDVDDLKVREVLEVLGGKTNNYFTRVLQEKARKLKEDIQKTLEKVKPDLNTYFKKLELQIKKRES